MTEISPSSQNPKDRSLVVIPARKDSPELKEEFGDKLPDIASLLAPRPGATREEITEEAERQLRIGLEAHLGKKLGIRSEILQELSLDQIRKLLAGAIEVIDGIRSFAKGSSAEQILRAIHREEKAPLKLANNSKEAFAQENDDGVDEPKKKKVDRKHRRRSDRQKNKSIAYQEAKEYRTSTRGLFNPESLSSNEFIKLGEESYSPFDFYGTYLGSEVRGLEENTKVKQRGDETSIPENALKAKKEKELAGSFVTSAPMKFFQSMLKALGMEDISKRFAEAREKLLNNRYRELKDSFNYSTSPSERNWQTILDKFNNELEIRSRATKKPGLIDQLRTKGLNSSFVSRVRSLWNDPNSLVLDKSMAA